VTEEILRKRMLGILHENPVFHPENLAMEMAALAIEHFRTIHSKALACHCECLAMNAENCYAACRSSRPPYRDAEYYAVMQKWGLINEEGEPLI